MTDDPTPQTRVSWKQWAKRLGVGGLIFFAVKGMLWLTVPALIAYCASQ
jgi:hypothetical protein